MTSGETLFIQRRRKHLNQEQAADAMGLQSADVYSMIERDLIEHAPAKIGPLNKEEIFVLLRRRADLTQEALAVEIGVSRLWINRMERGLENPGRLESYWRNRQV